MRVCSSEYERALLERAAQWPRHLSWKELTEVTLQQISEHEGLDFATALMYDRIARSPEHGPWVRKIACRLESADQPCRGTTLTIVPGACYAEYPGTGADGRRLRAVAEQLGCRVELIPVASFGSLSANARTICDWLTNRPEEPILLVSLSKGGADIKMALARPGGPQAFRNVRAWINLSGILYGTALASWFLNHPFNRLLIRLLCWYHGYHFPVVRELERRPGSPLDFELGLPAHLRVIHVVAFPLAGHLSSRVARRSYHRLAPLGPNDGGGILLGDLCRLPGAIYPLWGVDHYLRPRWDIRNLIRDIVVCVSTQFPSPVPVGLGLEQIA
jgi:hypothetical protein